MPLPTPQVHEVSGQDVTCLALDPLGRYSLTAGHDGLLRLWGCTPIARLRPHSLPPNQAFLGHPSAVLGTCCSAPCLMHPPWPPSPQRAPTCWRTKYKALKTPDTVLCTACLQVLRSTAGT